MTGISLWPPVFRALSGRGARARLSTLIFHRVVPERDELFPQEVDAQQFDSICRWLRRWFDVLPLDRAVAQLRDGSLPSRALAITLDAGYADNAQVAMPILQRHGLTATFFVATGFLDGGRMWNDSIIEAIRRTRRTELDLDAVAGNVGSSPAAPLPINGPLSRRTAVDAAISRAKYLPSEQRQQFVESLVAACDCPMPDDLMMSSDEVRSLRRGGMAVGAHTVNHPILARLDDTTALAEMQQSGDELKALLGEDIPLFAYPNGRPGDDYLPKHAEMARSAGFAAAVTTAWGVATAGTDLHQIPRFTPWDRTPGRFAARLARNLLAA